MKPCNIKIKKLDVFNSSIMGINLIEASAGTGKTFTIILLYLRLLLGIGNNNSLKKIFLDQMLVVTFTNSAKEELYIRIKKSIQNLYIACIEKKTTDHCSKLLLKEIPNIEKAILILKKAQDNMNNISIYTIHGFCKEMLQLHTFDLSANFEEKIIDDEDHLYLQATEDFWRKYFYNLPENIIKIVIQDYDSPKSLLKNIKPLLQIKSIIFEPKFKKNETIITFHNKIIKEIIHFKKTWLKKSKFILETIQNLNINKKKYSKSNISRWIKNISEWAKSITENYNIPIVLKYFSEENIKKNTINYICLKNIIFKETESIINKKFSLKNIVIFHAIKNINKLLIKEKKNSLLGFNDLLSTLLKNVKKDKNLKKIIIKKFPVAFIDEFQDTDINQYKIFDHIYKKNKKTALFLIGDPKQAIYNFRGADIFSYLYAKSKIKNHFYLDKNWRSSSDICKSINILFYKHKNPFLFKNIPYLPILPSIKNFKMNFKIKGSSQVALEFFLQNKKEVKIDEYQNWIADQCVNQISYWLHYAEKKEAIITTKKGEKILQLNDIAILVRNQKEADIIQMALKNKNISSIYSSDKKNIFQTFEAQELLWILQSILNPTDESLLKQSISTHIFKQLKYKEKKESRKKRSYFLIEKLYQYYKIWKTSGIFYMIKFIVLEYQKNFNSLKIETDYQKNINFLHIAELLQKESQFFYKKNSLIRWFEKKILQKNTSLYHEKIRNVEESKSIKIITIHKSKGLEYPIVWIPFGIDFSESKTPLYHDKRNFQTIFNTNSNSKNLELSDKERLSEDIRFLYVAITRSIVHCSIGIACLIKTKEKRINFNSHIHKSALGYIVQDGLSMNYAELFKKINEFNSKYIKIYKEKEKKTFYENKKNIYLILKNKIFSKNIESNYKITSFTQLKKESLLQSNSTKQLLIENLLTIEKIKENKKLTIHNFPKGKKAGLLIHYILKNMSFFNKKDDSWFSEILKKYKFSKIWKDVLITWIHTIINTPLDQKDICLSKLNKRKYIKEFEFFLPIKNILYSEKLNEITQFLDPISMLCPNISFHPVTGVIKGFIDLVFFWNNKYYILEYKSNWLGKDNNFYCDEYIKKEMIQHRYDLQYQIYTMAIHQYLTKKIKKYNYEDNFGGVFYMFLRAKEKNKKNNGIFHCIPKYSLIKKLITLFSNEK